MAIIIIIVFLAIIIAIYVFILIWRSAANKTSHFCQSDLITYVAIYLT